MTRTELALAACQGMTDKDISDRGPGGFAAMIDRKRQYAFAARALASANHALQAKLDAALNELAMAKTTINAMEALDAPITADTGVGDMLAAIFKKGQAS